MQKVLETLLYWFVYSIFLRFNVAANSPVRLVGSWNPSEGRVEIYYDGLWGTVCDDHWGEEETAVVCRQLGFESYIDYKISAYFGQGTDPIWLDDVICGGSEEYLDECVHRGWGTHNCAHGEDVGVRCSGERVTSGTTSTATSTTTLSAYPFTDTVRLVGGSVPTEGRVEVFHDGEWGTICDDSWGLEEANIVCRQLGHTSASDAPSRAEFGQGFGEIWLDNVHCTGTEARIEDCSHNGWGLHNCAHSEDAGAVCVDEEGSVKLVGGSTIYEGRVEIFHDSEWGSICDDGWSIDEGMVVCQQLGFSSALSVYRSGSGSGTIWLDDVECSGVEDELGECSHRGWGIHDCTHNQDAGVRCSPGIAENSLRLTDGASIAEGRVEIYHGDRWGTICDDGWDIQNAAVVCRQLGFPGVVSSHSQAHFGAGSGQIWLDNVECSGGERRLSSCSSNGWGQHNCYHGEDVGVTCQEDQGDSPGMVVLVDNQRRRGRSGRVEVFFNNTWGTVCSDLWTWNEANVVCSSLGYDDVDKWWIESADPGTGPIWLDNVRCDGTESALVYCEHAGWGVHNCDHTQDIAISCYNHRNFYLGHIGAVVGGIIGVFILLQYIKQYHQRRGCFCNNSSSTSPSSSASTSTSSPHHPRPRPGEGGSENPGFSGHYSRPDTAPPSYDSIYKYTAYPQPPPPDPETFSPEGGTCSPPPPYMPPSSNLYGFNEERPLSGSRSSSHSQAYPNTNSTLAPVS